MFGCLETLASDKIDGTSQPQRRNALLPKIPLIAAAIARVIVRDGTGSRAKGTEGGGDHAAVLPLIEG